MTTSKSNFSFPISPYIGSAVSAIKTCGYRSLKALLMWPKVVMHHASTISNDGAWSIKSLVGQGINRYKRASSTSRWSAWPIAIISGSIAGVKLFWSPWFNIINTFSEHKSRTIKDALNLIEEKPKDTERKGQHEVSGQKQLSDSIIDSIGAAPWRQKPWLMIKAAGHMIKHGMYAVRVGVVQSLRSVYHLGTVTPVSLLSFAHQVAKTPISMIISRKLAEKDSPILKPNRSWPILRLVVGYPIKFSLAMIPAPFVGLYHGVKSAWGQLTDMPRQYSLLTRGEKPESKHEASLSGQIVANPAAVPEKSPSKPDQGQTSSSSAVELYTKLSIKDRLKHLLGEMPEKNYGSDDRFSEEFAKLDGSSHWMYACYRHHNNTFEKNISENVETKTLSLDASTIADKESQVKAIRHAMIRFINSQGLSVNQSPNIEGGELFMKESLVQLGLCLTDPAIMADQKLDFMRLNKIFKEWYGDQLGEDKDTEINQICERVNAINSKTIAWWQKQGGKKVYSGAIQDYLERVWSSKPAQTEAAASEVEPEAPVAEEVAASETEVAADEAAAEETARQAESEVAALTRSAIEEGLAAAPESAEPEEPVAQEVAADEAAAEETARQAESEVAALTRSTIEEGLAAAPESAEPEAPVAQEVAAEETARQETVEDAAEEEPEVVSEAPSGDESSDIWDIQAAWAAANPGNEGLTRNDEPTWLTQAAAEMHMSAAVELEQEADQANEYLSGDDEPAWLKEASEVEQASREPSPLQLEYGSARQTRGNPTIGHPGTPEQARSRSMSSTPVFEPGTMRGSQRSSPRRNGFFRVLMGAGSNNASKPSPVPVLDLASTVIENKQGGANRHEDDRGGPNSQSPIGTLNFSA
ncbi:MAG: hypothetical protein VXY77_00155 [Pseudomonadota bacterium]|nr:hypothetical protein [Pseudomonadota bacterium]